jgi:hypothetical protein
MLRGRLLLGDERLGDAAGQGDGGQQSAVIHSRDPRREVREVLLIRVEGRGLCGWVCSAMPDTNYVPSWTHCAPATPAAMSGSARSTAATRSPPCAPESTTRTCSGCPYHPLAERMTASREDLADNHVVDLGPVSL